MRSHGAQLSPSESGHANQSGNRAKWPKIWRGVSSLKRAEVSRSNTVPLANYNTCSTGSERRTLILTSTREPSRLMIDIRRSFSRRAISCGAVTAVRAVIATVRTKLREETVSQSAHPNNRHEPTSQNKANNAVQRVEKPSEAPVTA